MNRWGRRHGESRASRALTSVAVLIALVALASGALSFLLETGGFSTTSATTGPTAASPPSTAASGAPAGASAHGNGAAGGSDRPQAKVVAALSVTPSIGNVSTIVTFSASNYAHSSAFNISFYDAAGKTKGACVGETTSTGTFSCTFVIPPLSYGAHVFTGVDGKGNTETATFTVKPKLALTPSSGLAGTPIAVQGTGFGAHILGEGTSTITIEHYTVSVNWSGGAVCSDLKMSAAGDFNCSLTLTPSPGGEQRFYAVDNASHKAIGFFDVITGLTVGPTYGPVGTNITFIGTGYHALATVTVSWTGGNACRVTTLGTGQFECNFVVPRDTPGGVYSFTANDSFGHSASAPFTVTYVESTPPNGPVGSHLTLSAGGFTPDTLLTIDFGSAVACPAEYTSSAGTLSCSYVVPPSVAGVHPITATDTDGESALGSFVVDPTVTITPDYGPAGTPIVINGTGFAASSLVEVTWAGPKACAVTSTATGAFQCEYTIPTGTAGASYLFTATDAADDVGTGTFTVTYLTIDPSSGPMYTNLTVSGGGFAPLATFTVDWGAKEVCSGAISANGALACTKLFYLKNATAGPQELVATDSDKNTASANFTVTPVVHVAPASGTVGTSVVFKGNGFAPSSIVTITWAGGTACTIASSTIGQFVCAAYTIAAEPTGTYVFTAVDELDNSAITTFTIGPALTSDPTEGTVGAPVVFSANGFDASLAISISWSGGVICSGTTSTTGTYSCDYALPDTPAGSYTFTAADSLSQSAAAAFTVEAGLTANPSSGANGTLVTFDGLGFASEKAITVSWTFGTACTTTSSVTGGFSCSYAIPPSPGGPYTFKASDGTNSATTTFTVTTGLTVSPGRGPVGATLSFSGAGYAKGTLVQVTWDGSKVACSSTALPTGGFSCTFKLPPTTAGTVLFTASDSADDTATVPFTVVPQLLPGPASGPVGTVVTFNGSGFRTNAAVSVTSPGLASCTATSNSSGSFACSATIPTTVYGVHEFTATDGVESATANFTVMAHLAATPPTGLVGTRVVFTGTGYASVVGVTVSWEDGTACSNTTTTLGQFSCAYIIPSGTPGGVYPFTGADGSGDTAVTTFTVTTSLAVTPGHGEALTPVVFSGTGFASSSTATVTWSGGTACSSATSASGTFSCDFTIPSGTVGGSYTFTATDARDDTASTTFIVSYLTASPSGAIAGGSVSFFAGGFTPVTSFSITWTGGSACAGTTTATGTFECSYSIPVFTSPGAYTFTGTDGTLIASTPFTVFGLPAVSVPTPTRSAGDIGQSVSFATTASGGSGTYSTYTWTESEPALGCALINAASILCTPTSEGNFTVTVQVTDSAGDSSSTATSAKYAVSLDPTVSTPTENVTSSDVGQSVTFSVKSTPGSGDLAYAWSGLPAGCAGTTATIVCAPTAADAGSSVTVTVTDSNDFSVASGVLSVVVFADPAVTTPTISRSTADVGQSVTFSTSASGGAGDLKFTWSGLPTGCAGTGATVTCTPTAPEAATGVHVTVVDANGYRVTSGSTSFTVYADPTLHGPSASRASADVGQTVTFSVTVDNGSGGFSYAWSGLPTGCAGTGSSVVCVTSAPGASSVKVVVTDSNGFVVTSGTLAFTVYPDPVAGTPTASSPGADLGQPVTFSAALSGGAPPVTYHWKGLPVGCSGTTATILCILSNASRVGEYAISYVATDGNGLNSTSGALAFRFDPDPTIATPTASRSSADVNQSVTFVTSATGGAGGYQYLWIGLPAGCVGAGATVVCTPTAPVSASSISVNLTDANGYTISSGVLVFSVYADPTVGAPTATAASADVGQTVTFSVLVSGGSGGFTYIWSGLPGGCSGTTATVTCAEISGADGYSVTVSVQDSNDVSVTSAALPFTVYTDPTVSTPTESQPGADIGQTVVFSVTASAAAGGLTILWVGLPSGCTDNDTAMVSCKPTAKLASTEIDVEVSDANLVTVTSASIAFSVDPTLAVTLSASSTSILQGKGVTFTAAVTGGASPYVYTWSGLPAGCSGTSTSASVSCTPSATGSSSVTVSVKDANGAVQANSVTVTVNGAFLGLPAAEGIALLAGGILLLVIVLVVALVLLTRRRRRTAAPLPWAPSPAAPPAASPTTVPPPAPWSPPAASTPSPDEPAPWEMPPPEPGPDEPGSPP